MIVSITWEKVFRTPVKVANMHDKIQTLLNRIKCPLHYHFPDVDLNNIVFSLKVHGSELDMNETFTVVLTTATQQNLIGKGLDGKRGGKKLGSNSLNGLNVCLSCLFPTGRHVT